MKNVREAVLSLGPKEMNLLAHQWLYHRSDCSNRGDLKIEFLGCPIGTNIYATCGCGKEFNITDYNSW